MSAKPTIYFVTTNDYKWRAFSEVLAKRHFTSYRFSQLKQETIEIQAQDNVPVAEFSAKWASVKFRKNVLKEDTGLFVQALGGFPGVYINDIEKQIGAAGILQLLRGIKNRQTIWKYSLSYCARGQEPVTFSAEQKGSLAWQAQGKAGLPADLIFIPEGETQTIAQLLECGTYQRNNQHYEALLDHLQKTKSPSA